MFKPFNKNRTIGNIYFLAKEKGLKMGDVEKNAGVSPGYLSRINKSDNTSIPGVDLMYGIAQQLGVSVDTLLVAHYEQLTKAEKYVLDFIQKLMDDTKNDKINWTKLSTLTLQYSEDIANSCELFENNEYIHYSEENPMGIVRYRPNYRSKFHEEGLSVVKGNGYKGEIDAIGATIYLMNVEHKSENYDIEQEYELYVYANESMDGICNSAKVCDELSQALGQLYETLEESFSHVKLSRGVKALLDMYMQEEA